MTKTKWKRELDRLLENFEIESTISLSKINHYFEGLGRPFDEKFREYFLDKSTQRLNTSFDIVQFDGCSKTPIEKTPNTSTSKQAADIPKQVKIKSNESSKSNNDTNLDIANFVQTFVESEFNVGNEVEHNSKNISDNTGGQQESNVTSEMEFNSKNVGHENISKKTDRAKISQKQLPIDSIVKLFNFKCNECDYTSNSRFHLGRHKKIHDFQRLYGIVQDPTTKLFQCSHCVRQFLKWNNLKSHLVSHWNNRSSYKCVHCLRVFVDELKRDRHEKRCKGRRFECHLCKQYVTYYMNNMIEHMRTHSGVKPLQCTICNACFRHKASLKTHLNLIHSCGCIHN